MNEKMNTEGLSFLASKIGDKNRSLENANEKNANEGLSQINKSTPISPTERKREYKYQSQSVSLRNLSEFNARLEKRKAEDEKINTLKSVLAAALKKAEIEKRKSNEDKSKDDSASSGVNSPNINTSSQMSKPPIAEVPEEALKKIFQKE
jgi:hypothetical protein